MSEISVGSITTKGQITIPKEIRERLELKEGDKIIFIIEAGRATIKKAPVEKLSQILRRHKPWKTQSVKFQKRIRREWQ
ncbi:MAG: AbrB/MazE/SpoVT family DNA-binding domain-containing protein [Candidatus Nitrosotenuis sp.]|uniref:Regulators of stationary/sporulation gene expression n=1 Tax=Candidatus Nitrosotenuis uzonensis TaxID=1407055 RepID=V6AVB3_9ARCH|nr:AbrB/MazE/SpoVT family DNA-binding domain-containing protein [Candidatus Nitrosotenuis uzonensis]MCA2003450.1 type II toxin-antitoxin system PrlF family antitoxin [Candidatus Nitrosotenuis sp.]CAE6488306.1 Regulators of stationary/sporulation gene expression [Candidatus Nitrosotenuis uzonensis]CDI06499.1 Regulators of stationary/sporulation gene expression [Candidatus Nitrosotenuis uzonensis]